MGSPAGIDLFAHGVDGRLYGGATSDGIHWSTFDPINSETLQWNDDGIGADCVGSPHFSDGCCPDCYSPAASARLGAGGAIRWDTFVRARDDQVLVTTYTNGAWGPYRTIGGVAMTGPGGVSTTHPTGRSVVAINMQEEVQTGVFESSIWWKQFTSPF